MVDSPSTIGRRLKDSVDKALTGDIVRAVIQAAMADTLTKATVLDALLDALKNHDGYKQHLVASIAPVAERIAT